MPNVYVENNPSQFRSFEDKAVRRRFVAKVYTLLVFQLVITFGIITGCMFIEPVRTFMKDDYYVMIGTIGPGFIIHLILMFWPCARHIVPINYILLTLMSILYGVGFGELSARVETYIIFASLALTIGIMLLLTIVAMLPCLDLTSWGIYLCFAGIGLVICGTVAGILGFYYKVKIIFLIYSVLMAVLFSLYVIYDTQMILGGKQYELSPEEYIVGAVILYTDFIYIFLAAANVGAAA